MWQAWEWREYGGLQRFCKRETGSVDTMVSPRVAGLRPFHTSRPWRNGRCAAGERRSSPTPAFRQKPHAVGLGPTWCTGRRAETILAPLAGGRTDRRRRTKHRRCCDPCARRRRRSAGDHDHQLRPAAQVDVAHFVGLCSTSRASSSTTRRRPYKRCLIFRGDTLQALCHRNAGPERLDGARKSRVSACVHGKMLAEFSARRRRHALWRLAGHARQGVLAMGSIVGRNGAIAGRPFDTTPAPTRCAAECSSAFGRDRAQPGARPLCDGSADTHGTPRRSPQFAG